MINAEKYMKAKAFHLSYEIGVMIALADIQPTNIHMAESIERLAKNMPLNGFFIVDGIMHAGDEYGVVYTREDIVRLIDEYDLKDKFK
ncbi:hypothetical protein PQE66_gp031 [Bacillus phage PBC2]|uniref:Uncharacterized protein n=1 Tax=Bacillus phage PBC2 TaxID=1675029 RepID=A0A218KBT6_9CAUD|nr:hypothetical protein PQE66_gp031 [Bacillus phage PBC2]AKQ08346.1 hypothetical protein PBC2_031 [Bacillus phage PBC2]